MNSLQAELLFFRRHPMIIAHIMLKIWFCLALSLPFAAFADGATTFPNSQRTPFAVEVLTGWRQSNEGEVQHIFALKIVLAEGWKTYWRLPGENGIPPEITWTKLRNASQPIMHFPAPRLIVDSDVSDSVIGYTHHVVFPIVVNIPNPPVSSIASGQFTFGVCEQVCIPHSVNFQASLAADADIWVDEITDARASHVKTSDAPFFCQIRPNKEGELTLLGRLETELGPPVEVAVVPEYPDSKIWFSNTTSSISADGGINFQSRLHHPRSASTFGIERSRLEVTMITPESAIMFSNCNGTQH